MLTDTLAGSQNNSVLLLGAALPARPASQLRADARLLQAPAAWARRWFCGAH